MTPSIPTYRPLFTATRVAALVAVASIVASLVLLAYGPADAAAVACAAPVDALR